MNAPLPKLANVESLPGYHMTATIVTCGDCLGSGEIYRDSGPSGLTYPCPNCDGAGCWPELESNHG